MPIFAATLPQVARPALLLLAELTFWLYVALSFICVAGYATRQIRAGSLIGGHAAPPSFAIPPVGASLLAFNIFILFFVPSNIYWAAVLIGLLVVWVVEKRCANDRSLLIQAGGWLFVLNVLALLFWQMPIFMILVVAGQSLLLLEGRRNPADQFGLVRLSAAKLLTWSILICGAVILIEVPLGAAVDEAMKVLPWPNPVQESVETFRNYKRASEIFVFMVQAVVVSPMIEELFFRGFLLTFLKKYTSTWMALVLSAGVFAFAHVNLGAAIQLWFLGVVLGVAYEHTGSLLLPMCIHGCFNLVEALNLLVEKGNFQ